MITTVILINGGSALLALLLNVIPGADSSWANASPIVKRLIMAVLIAAWAAAVYGLSCAGLLASLNWYLTCDQEGLQLLIQVYLAAVGTNTLTYQVTEKFKRADR